QRLGLAKSALEQRHGGAKAGGHPQEERLAQSVGLLLEHRQHLIERGAVAALREIVGAEDERTELCLPRARFTAENFLGRGQALGQGGGTEQADEAALEDE